MIVGLSFMQTAKEITARGFRPYGKVIEYPGKEKKGTTRNLWRIVHCSAAKTGWRVAYLVLRDKALRRLEYHPFSDETFEPVRGKALLFVAAKRDLNAVKCFLLDRPVVLRKGIWHGLITLSDEAEIKITENLQVPCDYWPFGFRIKSLEDLQRRAISLVSKDLQYLKTF